MFEFLTIKEVKTNIGMWCKEMRKAENLTQQALADALALSRFTIVKLENGENATLDTVLKVLQYFDAMQSLNDFVVNKVTHLKDNPSFY